MARFFFKLSANSNYYIKLLHPLIFDEVIRKFGIKNFELSAKVELTVVELTLSDL